MSRKIVSALIALVVLSSFSWAESKPSLIFYCGITMVKPIKKIAKIIEKKHNCTIRILQGGSQDLYDSLKVNKIGDLYLAGSKSYRTKNLKDGLLGENVYIGYNKAAIFVRKGNPFGIKDLNDLDNQKLNITLCDPETGSIGKMTKKLLVKFKGEEFYEKLYEDSAIIGTDSRNLNMALINKEADATINWRATGFWGENSKYVDIIEIDSNYAPKKELIINLLKFAKYPKIAREFMKFASGKEGKKIMKEYGFSD
jgi:molybdate transport system substrate-binding protein